MKTTTKAALSALLLAIAANAGAVPVTYSFGATYWFDAEGPASGNVFTAAPGLFSAPAIAGTFTYDNEAAFVSGSEPAIYRGAITDFSASVGGYSISDPTGYGTVHDPLDQYVLSVDPDVLTTVPPELRNISGFAIGDWSLINVRLFWVDAPDIEGDTDPVLDDQLPTTLAPAGFTPEESRVALDFVDATTNLRHIMFFQQLSVTPTSVPLPGTLGLFGIGLMACLRRKRALMSH